MEKLTKTTDDITLLEIFILLWRGKILIILCIIIAIGLSAVKLRNSSYLHTVSMTLTPVVESNSGGNMRGLEGLASFAGISLPTSNLSDFKKFQIMMTSEKIAASLFTNEKLIKALYRGEWSEDQSVFIEPQLSRQAEIRNYIKKLITGKERNPYIQPNARRLATMVKNTINISLDKKSNFLKLSAEGSNPKVLMILMENLVKHTDEYFKIKFVKTAKDAINFYQIKIAKARSKEHREVLAKLISREEQGLMLASSDTSFVAEILLSPKISLLHTSPKPADILLIRVFFGVLIACMIILARAYWPKIKPS